MPVCAARSTTNELLTPRNPRTSWAFEVCKCTLPSSLRVSYNFVRPSSLSGNPHRRAIPLSRPSKRPWATIIAMETQQSSTLTSTRSTQHICECSHKPLSDLSGDFDSQNIDWWDASWGNYFRSFNDFLGFGWEAMGELLELKVADHSCG